MSHEHSRTRFIRHFSPDGKDIPSARPRTVQSISDQWHFAERGRCRRRVSSADKNGVKRPLWAKVSHELGVFLSDNRARPRELLIVLARLCAHLRISIFLFRATRSTSDRRSRDPYLQLTTEIFPFGVTAKTSHSFFTRFKTKWFPRVMLSFVCPVSSNISSQSVASVVYWSITQTRQIINLLLLSNFYPAIYRWIRKEDELYYNVVWSLVMVREPVTKSKRLKQNQQALYVCVCNSSKLIVDRRVGIRDL